MSEIVPNSVLEMRCRDHESSPRVGNLIVSVQSRYVPCVRSRLVRVRYS